MDRPINFSPDGLVQMGVVYMTLVLVQMTLVLVQITLVLVQVQMGVVKLGVVQLEVVWTGVDPKGTEFSHL